MAISIEDTREGTMYASYHYAHHQGYMEAERWATHVKAAVNAVPGTDNLIIAPKPTSRAAVQRRRTRSPATPSRSGAR